MPAGEASPLTIRLFGPFEVLRHGEPLPRVRSRGGHWLLALLLLRSGREVERAWLAGTLWPNSPAPQAFSSLRSTLAGLRDALGPDARRLRSPTPKTLCLDLSAVEVDVLAFDAAIARGDVGSLEEAVALYRGLLLEGCVAEWVYEERHAREQAYLQALETLATRALAAGDRALAERHLCRAVATDPVRESAQRALTQLLAAGGNYAAASQVYRELRLRLHCELNAEPDPETSALFQQLRAEACRRASTHLVGTALPPALSNLSSASAAHPLPPRLHNLPLQPTLLIGRETEVAAARDLLQREDVRLVTFTGPGGSGKTRLAFQVAADLLGSFPDGVFFVSLAPIRDPGLVTSSIAQTLGVRETGPRSLLESLKDALRETHRLLLLDNFEQVLAAAPQVAELLASCPRLKVLVTSRALLHLRGEHDCQVPPLPAPDPKRLPPAGTDELSRVLSKYAAVELFIQRAVAVQSDFTVTNENAPAVAEICYRLDGLPLAIELAAARIRLLSPQALLARLENRLKLLTGGARDLPARHQTLRGAIAWSYDLLTDRERRLFRRLSVFAGGASLEAIEAVCMVAGDLENDLLDGVASLVDKSLLRRDEGGVGEPRFTMLETIREYGREELAASGASRLVLPWPLAPMNTLTPGPGVRSSWA